MSSSFSSFAASQTLPSSILSSGFLSSSIMLSGIGSSATLTMEPSTSGSALSASDSSLPFPSPPPSSSTDFLPSPSSSSSTGSSSLSSDSSDSTSYLSILSSQLSFDSTSSTSSNLLGTTPSESPSAITYHRNTLRPVEIAAISLGVVTAALGFIAVLLLFFFRRKRHHHPLYGLPENQNKGLSNSSRNTVQNRETPSTRSYFRSLAEQKGTTPLLQKATPNTSDLSHDELYRDNEQSPFALPTPSIPSPSFVRQETSYYASPQNTIRPLRDAPPLKTQEYPQQLSPAIPDYIALKPSHLSLQPPTRDSDALPKDEVLAYADENVDLGRDSPSIYSQASGNFRFSSYSASLSRGPSVSSHVSRHRFSVPSTVLESSRADTDTGSDDNRTISGETITPATRNSVSPPPDHLVGVGHNTNPPFIGQERRSSGLERQNTTTIASLLKTRQQRRSAPLPTEPSAVSHLERVGSIRPAPEADGDAGSDERRSSTRRFGRSKGT